MTPLRLTNSDTISLLISAPLPRVHHFLRHSFQRPPRAEKVIGRWGRRALTPGFARTRVGNPPKGGPRMDLPHFSRREAAFIIGVPIAWAVLLLFHPGGDGTSIYADLTDNVTPMLVVHIG